MEKRKFQIGTGITTILMIFVVLCLTAFGVLSYSTAKADKNLVDKNNVGISAVYEAQNKVETCISKVDSAIYDVKKKATNNAEYINLAKASIQNIKEENSMISMDDGKVTIEVSIDKYRTFQAVLNIEPVDNNKRFTIDTYRVVSEGEWNGGEKLDFN